MEISKLYFIIGFTVTFITSIIDIIMRFKTGYDDWGEPVFNIIQSIGIVIAIIGAFFYYF